MRNVSFQYGRLFTEAETHMLAGLGFREHTT